MSELDLRGCGARVYPHLVRAIGNDEYLFEFRREAHSDLSDLLRRDRIGVYFGWRFVDVAIHHCLHDLMPEHRLNLFDAGPGPRHQLDCLAFERFRGKNANAGFTF